MPPAKVKPLIMAMAIGLAAVQQAHAESIQQQILDLVKAGSPQQAITLAEKHLFDLEGDPEFDFAYGLAALDAGQPNQAIFALERVVQARQGDLRARLELARAYYKLEQYEASRMEFDQVLASNPPKVVRDNVQRYLDAMTRREARSGTTTRAYVSFGGGYDNNLNSAPDEPSFMTPTGLGTIASTSLAANDTFMDLSAGASVAHPLKRGITLSGKISGNRQIHFDENRFDRATANINAGVSWALDQNTLRLQVMGQKHWVKGDVYRKMLGYTGEVRHRYGNGAQVNAYGQVLDMDYLNPSRDSTQMTIGMGGLYGYSGKLKPLVYAALFGSREYAKLPTPAAEILCDRVMGGGRLGVQLGLMANLNADFSADYRHSNYLKTDTFFNTRRQDDQVRLSMGSTWRFEKGWSAHASLAWNKNDSNIDIHKYSGTRFSLNVRYDF